MSKTFVLNLGKGADVQDYTTGAYTHVETEKEAIIRGGFVTVANNSERDCSVQIYGDKILEYINEVLHGSYTTLSARVTSNGTIIITHGAGSNS